MFKFLTIAFSAAVMLVLSSQSADAQLFRGRGLFSSSVAGQSTHLPSVTYAPSVSRPAPARPVPG